ncbi:putative ATPase [Pseudoduganella lurida]|uniref:Putative ATPase n=1 Tax=Pseudoduganella lurida TaxID=1036180 RepID=A0A562REI2_9BURK|nr:winged helix-turn-helix domain-containing protein [Pseudoduganella lurida]TWI67461.1 putative ATPase [Pseudoduganella lurida]
MGNSFVATGERAFAFGAFVLVPERQALLQDGVAVRLGGRALDILTALVERAGELVSKRELLARVWPDTIVDESNLKVNVAALRRALGDGGSDDACYIATVNGRGYRLIAPVTPGALSDFAPGAVAPPPRLHNLPTGTTRVLGRADAIDAIRRDFGVARLVTIVGPGGIGKTTVALAVAEQAIGSYRDGVWLVDLALTKAPHMTASAIAAVVGAAGGAPDSLEMLCRSLRERDMLLVLDSCEHVIDACAACASAILAQAPDVRILVTSREPLRLPDERVRRLPGLATPPSLERLDAQEAMMFPAVQLFVDRATDRVDSFTLRDDEAPAVAEICQRLDGLALAIELAATRIDAFGVGGLLRQLDHCFGVLTGRRSGPERHRTLAATLAWSYGLLSVQEAALLRAVAVFAGFFDSDGAAVVAAIPRDEATALLAQLAAKSLLMTGVDGNAIAYRLLETTHVYCAEKLRASGEDHAVRQRHAQHMCATLERAAGEWARLPAGEWEKACRDLLGDLRVALGWTGHVAPDGPLSIRLTVAGLLLWNHFSLTEECDEHASHAVAALDAAGLTGTALEMKLKLSLGGARMFTRGLTHEVTETLQRALQIAAGIGDTDYQLRCLMMLGIHALFAGQHVAALRTLERFAAVARVADPSVLPESEVHMGIAELFLGKLPASRHRLESLARRDLRYYGSYSVRYLSDPIVLVRSALMHAQWLTGSPDTAMRTAAAAMADARLTRHHLSLNNVLSYACALFYWAGDHDECARYVAMLDEQIARHGLITRKPVASFYGAAVAYAREGASAAVIGALRRAIDEFNGTNHLARMPYYLSVLADALDHGGHPDAAETTIGIALDKAAEQQEQWCLPEVWRIQAGMAARRGQAERAATLLLDAMKVASETGALAWRLRAATDLATLWRAGPRDCEARALLAGVRAQFTEGFATRDLADVARLLAQWQE